MCKQTSIPQKWPIVLVLRQGTNAITSQSRGVRWSSRNINMDGGITFQMRGRGPNAGFDRKVVHGQHSLTTPKILGNWHVSGPQPIGGGGCPQWVDDAFAADPKLKRVVLVGEGHGSVYSRMDEHAMKPEEPPHDGD